VAIEKIREAIKEGHRRIVVQAPCGFGKTILAAHMVTSSMAKGRRPLFTCPAIALVNQTLEAFEREGIDDIGIIMADHERTNYECQMQIASVQTLIRRELPEVDFIIVDEVHLSWEALYKKLDGDEWKEKIAIGLSATPWSKGMGLHWSKLIIAATINELIEDEHLSPFVVYAPAKEFEPDLHGVKTVAGDFEEKGLAQAVDKSPLVADIVRTWKDKAGNEPTFLFAVNRAHAQHLQREFSAAQVPCGYIDAYSDDYSRESTFRRFRSGEDKIIASVGCLIQGVDEDVRVIVDAAPTKSEIRHVQKIGRGLRTAPGKRILTVLDHAGNTLRLGMVTDIYHDTLDMRKPGDRGEAYEGEKRPSSPKKCEACRMIIPPGKRECPGCGTPCLKNHVMTIDGELELFEPGTAPVKKPKEKKHEWTKEEKQEFYSGFLKLAQDRGHSKGWAAYSYRAKFGVWPRGLEDIPMEPNYAVTQFDRHRRIQWAKSHSNQPQRNEASQ
jgi:superfamily II DNA or RNA helicase